MTDFTHRGALSDIYHLALSKEGLASEFCLLRRTRFDASMPPMMYYGKGKTRNRNIPVLATGVEGETCCGPHARAVPGLNRYFAQIAVKGALIRASGHSWCLL